MSCGTSPSGSTNASAWSSGAHYGLGQPGQTLDQIGARLGLTAERARQIEVGALNKLREALAQPAPIGTGPGDEDVHRGGRTVSGLGALLLELLCRCHR